MRPTASARPLEPGDAFWSGAAIQLDAQIAIGTQLNRRWNADSNSGADYVIPWRQIGRAPVQLKTNLLLQLGARF